MTYGAVVFDLWNTLVPLPRETRTRATDVIAETLGIAVTAFRDPWRATGPARDRGADMAVELGRVCVGLGVNVSRADLDRALAARDAVYAEGFVPRDDAVPTIEALRADGRRVGLVSNCTADLRGLVAGSALGGLFDALVLSCEERVVKPDPAIYMRAISRLGTRPERCLYVGDGADDELAGARAVGMTAVLLDPEDTRPPSWDGARVSALSEVVALVAHPRLV
jgi:putative hydrolase of the HAD superfamily